jgi:tetratricopeptide (TPR) repeat protein
MSLRNRIRLIWIALAVLLAAVWFQRRGNLGVNWELQSGFLVIVIGLIVSNILFRRSLRRFRSALAIEDIPAARREHADLADLCRRRGREMIKAYHINILLLEEQYQDALNELRALNLSKLVKNAAPVVQNQIAWCQMHLGDPEKALQIAQSVLPQLEKMGTDYGLSGHDVVGTAKLFLGKPSEAVPHLEKVCVGSAHLPAMKASAAFYLGEAFSALGEPDEAREAYQHAHDVLPNSRYGMRASERLKTGPANRRF